jgi:hypothetical protein
MFGLNIIDLPFLAGNHSLASANIPNDDMESYPDGIGVTGLQGGQNGTHLFTISWTVPYVDKDVFTGIISVDDMESYADGAAVNGLNGQMAYSRGQFITAYVDRFGLLANLAMDDMESYADGASVNGLNGGTNYGGPWTSAYVDR